MLTLRFFLFRALMPRISELCPNYVKFNLKFIKLMPIFLKIFRNVHERQCEQISHVTTINLDADKKSGSAYKGTAHNAAAFLKMHSPIFLLNGTIMIMRTRTKQDEQNKRMKLLIVMTMIRDAIHVQGTTGKNNDTLCSWKECVGHRNLQKQCGKAKRQTMHSFKL